MSECKLQTKHTQKFLGKKNYFLIMKLLLLIISLYHKSASLTSVQHYKDLSEVTIMSVDAPSI